MSVNLVQFIVICLLLVAILLDVSYIAQLLSTFVKEFWEFMYVDEDEDEGE